MSRSGSAGEAAEGGNRKQNTLLLPRLPPPNNPYPPIHPPTPLSAFTYFLANLWSNPRPPPSTHTHRRKKRKKKKTAMGSSTSCPPGGAL